MEHSRTKVMDVATPRRAMPVAAKRRVPRRYWWIASAVIVLLIAGVIGAVWYTHRNDQVVLHDRYQAVYTVTGKLYFGKLQNTTGPYLTLTHVYSLESQKSTTGTSDASSSSDLVQVSRQVYGPDDSMAIRADQVQFWQNLRSDSKVSQAIQSAGQSQ